MIGDMDAPMSPDQKGFTSMDRWLCGNTDDMRQDRREQVLGTTAKDFADFGEKLEIVSKSGTVAVIGSASALEDSAVSAMGLEMKKLL